MTSNQYKLRIYELKEEGLSSSEIARKIYREYGIRLKMSQIIEIGEKEPEISPNQAASSPENIRRMISTVLKESNHPLTSRAITGIIRSRYHFRITKSDVNKYIYQYLKDEVYYDRYRFTYSWRESNDPVVQKKVVEKNEFVNQRLNSLLGDFRTIDYLKRVESYFRNNLIQVSSGTPQIDELIKSVVKDNKITECEEIFLKSKAKEFGYSEDIISLAKASLESNNPYLDNLIHIIFDDGLVTPEELTFLREKTHENGFSPSFVNERFWMIGLAEYLPHLLKIELLDKVMILFSIGNEIEPDIFFLEGFLKELSIYNSNDLSIIAEKTLKHIKTTLNFSLKSKYEFEYDYSEFILENALVSKLEMDPKSSDNLNDQQLLQRFMKLINQERKRIGSPDVNLMVENITYRIENNLWD